MHTFFLHSCTALHDCSIQRNFFRSFPHHTEGWAGLPLWLTNRLDALSIRVRSPTKAGLFLLDIVKTCCGGSASYFSHCLIAFFPCGGGGVKSSKRGNPFNAEIERWSYTSTSPHIFKAWYRKKCTLITFHQVTTHHNLSLINKTPGRWRSSAEICRNKQEILLL